MKDSYNIKIVKRYAINSYGMPLVIICGISMLIFIFSTSFDYEYSVESTLWFFGISGVLILLGFWMNNIRKLESAKIEFHPEGLILKCKIGYIPIKYGQIKKIPISHFSVDPENSYFYLYTMDSRKYEIKVNSEIYEGLIATFPDKG